MTRHIALMALLTIAAPATVFADDTGVASLHDMKYETGRRVCMTDHFHDGSGVGKTRKEAEAVAKRSWIEFTVFEYGTDWGSFERAESPATECSEAGDKWSCVTTARPCRLNVKAKSGGSKSASR
jgi:hypothetical protein